MVPERTVPLTVPLDMRLTLRPLWRGRGDPTMRLGERRALRAWRSPEGPVTVELLHEGDRVVARAWGEGAGAALDGVASLLGLDDGAAESYDPGMPLLRELRHRLPGLRIGRTNAVLDALVPAILEQKVTGAEAHAALRRLVAAHGEIAPGGFGLRLLPDAATLAGLPPYEYHPLGIEERRAMTLRRVGARAAWLERAAALPAADAQARLRSIAGVGSWTAAEVGLRALGDPDAVSVGDFHLPHLVAWALAREPRGTDERMLELLEPFRGQRGRVIRWLEASGIVQPRFGPRQAPRWLGS